MMLKDLQHLLSLQSQRSHNYSECYALDDIINRRNCSGGLFYRRKTIRKNIQSNIMSTNRIATQENKLIKSLITLEISGKAVIIFGFWNIVKFFLTFSLDNKYVEEIKGLLLEEIPDMPEDVEILYVAFLILAAIILILDCFLRLYVGKCAHNEADGKKKHYAYIVLAFLMCCVSVGSIGSYFTSGNNFETGGGIGSMVVEITSLLASLDLVISGIKVHMYRKESNKNAA